METLGGPFVGQVDAERALGTRNGIIQQALAASLTESKEIKAVIRSGVTVSKGWVVGQMEGMGIIDSG